VLTSSAFILPTLSPPQVYFYWVCRDQKEFDWFSWLIEELSNLGDRFELNTYLTGELDLDQMIKQHTTPDGYQVRSPAPKKYTRITHLVF
jgi:hypothetical protein